MALLELDDALAHLVDDGRVVGCHDDRGARAIDALEELHDALGRRRVEIAGGLVRDEDGRLVDEGACDGDALLLATGQLIGHALFLAFEADELEHLGDDALHLTARLADDLESEGDVVEDGLVGQEPEVLEDRADPAPKLGNLPVGEATKVLAGHPDATLGGGLLLEDEPEERRLARARGTHEEDELPLLDLEGHALQGRPGLGGVELGDVLEQDHPMSVGRGTSRASIHGEPTASPRRRRWGRP